MTSRFAILTVLGMFSVLMAAPAHLHGLPQTQASQHEEHHPGTADTPTRTTVPEPQANMMAAMTASDAKIDALVKKMNSATGSKKTDAIAELLTALVQEHRMMRGSMMTNMSSMMDMMKMMGHMGGRGDAGSPTPNK
jgi:hypothetical protein